MISSLVAENEKKEIEIIDDQYKMKRKKLLRIAFTIIGFALVAPFVVASLLSIPKVGFIIDDPGAWISYWGSFVASIVAVTVPYLIYRFQALNDQKATEIQQKRNQIQFQWQLDENNNQFERQQRENHFFQQLNLFHELQTELKSSSYDIRVIGKKHELFTGIYKKVNIHVGLETNKSLDKCIEEIISGHHAKLGNYFRLLHVNLKYINDNFENKEDHIRLIRALLSEQELFLIYYNAFYTERGLGMKKQLQKSTNFFGASADYTDLLDGKDYIYGDLSTTIYGIKKRNLDRNEFYSNIFSCMSKEEQNKIK